ncbi:hypothetical protein LBMAG57_24770 [Verrucomicrobiota bacterium]|nr:hypothetical protein LBMAG57_24770 [Verrucomicrobiota bacterium]
MIARPYQSASVESVEQAFREFSKVLGVAATGAGKTIVFSMFTQRHIAERDGNRVLIIAHREELLTQAAQKLMRATGINSELERADARASLDARVVVASIQTLCRRFERFPANHFTRIIVDECHHALADSYQPTLQHFLGGGAKVLGVTATPGTKGKKALGNFFETIAFEVGLIELIRAGYLSPISVKSFPLIADKAAPAISFAVKNGDYDQEQVDHALDPYLESIVARLGAEIGDRKTLVFLPLIKTVERFVALCNAAGLKAAGVSGVSEERADILSAHGTDFQILANSMLLTEGYDDPAISAMMILRPTRSEILFCLDEQTEILTSEGWKKDVRVGESVAAFDPASESIRFVPAIQSTRRPLLPDEAFYSIKSQSADIRVTSNHRMLYDHKKRTGWKFKTAEELSKLRDTSYLPCAGYTRSRGVPLTDDELRFIGWVMTDGTINKATGGICITQGAHQPWLEEIEKCIIGCGFKFTRGVRKRVSQFKSNSDCVFWTISKGKPRGTDLHLRGWGAIYEYLSKDFSEKLMEVSSRQFDVLIQAIHLGDGAKQGGRKWTRRSFHISTGNKVFADRLQITAVLNGYRCNVAELHYNENPIYCVHLKKQNWMRIGGDGKDRPTWGKNQNLEGERCWCVQNEVGTLITRRFGKVAIVGNSQMVGRGTRVYCPWGCTERCTHGSRKRNLLLLDPLWLHEDMNLVRPANLVTGRDEDRRSMSERVAAKQEELDLLNMLADAEHEREKSLAEKLARMEKRKTKTISVEEWAVLAHAPNVADFEPTMKWHESPISPKQAEMLVRFGFDAGSVRGRGHASALLDVFFSRRKQGLATVAQVRLLKNLKHPNPETETFAGAKAWLDQRFSKTTK